METGLLERNKEQLKNPSQTVINCAKTVFQAMAFYEVIKDKIEPRQKYVLELIKAKDKRTGEPITSTKHDYLMSDDQFAEYLEEIRHEYAKLGYTQDKYQKDGICPLLEAETLVRDAKRALIIALEPVTGIAFDDLLECLEVMTNILS